MASRQRLLSRSLRPSWNSSCPSLTWLSFLFQLFVVQDDPSLMHKSWTGRLSSKRVLLRSCVPRAHKLFRKCQSWPRRSKLNQDCIRAGLRRHKLIWARANSMNRSVTPCSIQGSVKIQVRFLKKGKIKRFFTWLHCPGLGQEVYHKVRNTPSMGCWSITKSPFTHSFTHGPIYCRLNGDKPGTLDLRKRTTTCLVKIFMSIPSTNT